MKFRLDINALRALSVFIVVVFHFFPKILPGGFAGVDVFFVISGYLMTGIIYRRLSNDSFNLVEFYIARCNRIIPALAVVCVAVIILGWFILTPMEYRSLGKHVASSIGFISNFIYWREAGYFDVASLNKWLLHTWSLSVEWQFYMLFPIFMLLIKRFLGLKNIFFLIIITFLCAFLLSLYLTYNHFNFAYFSIFGRAWELLLGSIVFFVQTKYDENKYSSKLFYIGIILILVSAILYNSHSAWPGYLALLPTIGAGLILIGNDQSNPITSNKVIQKIGLSSYSIYLWHWPIVVFIYYYDLEAYLLVGFILSFILGFLSYKYIESFKFVKKTNFKGLVFNKPVWMVLIIGIFASTIFISNGFISRFPLNVQIASKETFNINPFNCIQSGNKNEKDYCTLGSGRVGAIIVGDSHADSLTTALLESQEKREKSIKAYTRSGCPFILDAHRRNDNGICFENNIMRMSQIESQPGIPVVIVARYPSYIYGQNAQERLHENDGTLPMSFDKPVTTVTELLKDFEVHLQNTVCTITPNNPVYLVQPIPEMERHIPNTYVNNYLHNTNVKLYITKEEYQSRAGKIRDIINDVAKECGSHVLDPSEYLCSEDKCHGVINDRPIYYDSDHLSEYGNKFLVPMFDTIK